MLHKTFIVLSIFPLLFSLAHAQEKTVSVATLEDYAPFCFTTQPINSLEQIPPGSDSAALKGYSWDVLRASFHRMNYSIELNVSPWARAIKLVSAGNKDILFPTGKNSERQKIFLYSKEPINQANFRIYVRQDSPIVWSGLESIKGLTIGQRRGFNFGDKWNNLKKVHKLKLNSTLQGFKMLDAGRVDGIVSYEFITDYALKNAGWKNTYKKLPVFDSTAEYLVALKSNPRAQEILNDFDEGKRHLIKTGELKKIEDHWFQSPN
ncbi:ABC transporter substrate-binding protein [Motiliproteus sp. MSK22-1]|uniref:substrate-binding periplasmic protein n=1 Tax=Motiliproteus sp. MSK22-1 TaxID=1897630 RepID=UPI000977F973|nr:transporter substrate-binding domain-containing protein [Motiliproteus sp. MSK22-1]OMH31742.1 amino acid ABC transporter substrate-binding protein [Motiliproteus sp. MSK22-1]